MLLEIVLVSSGVILAALWAWKLVRGMNSITRDMGCVLRAAIDAYSLLEDPKNVPNVEKARRILQTALVKAIDAAAEEVRNA